MEGNYKKWLNRINAKQDVLTEDNVGEFMDLELATKSTPTSGDTVLARDSLTGKAVEIPTSSFGGSGGGSGLALGETSSTAYRGDRGKIAYDHSQTTGNPHGTTKADIDLGNVDNTSDLNKPISTATQNALNSKQDKLQDATGNIGIGKTDASATEKLDVNGNVKANGFKTPNGTANQSLTADGGVFDLNAKANIVDIPSKTSFTHDILVSNWSLVSGKYEAVISNSGILADSFVDVIPSNDHVDIVRVAQIYPSVLISAGSVKVYSKFMPSGTISVTVNII